MGGEWHFFNHSFDTYFCFLVLSFQPFDFFLFYYEFSGASVSKHIGVGTFFVDKMSLRAKTDVSLSDGIVDVACASVEGFLLFFYGIGVEVVIGKLRIVFLFELFCFITHNTNNYRQHQL